MKCGVISKRGIYFTDSDHTTQTLGRGHVPGRPLGSHCLILQSALKLKEKRLQAEWGLLHSLRHRGLCVSALFYLSLYFIIIKAEGLQEP